ncbi:MULTISPECIES: SDR family NAD(P)-dependent oxidoreductase [unclassified Brevibacterium]|uniref:SDR family NAD(P)-dependent oxidoreductase n=1 Tax=unclassified Brevibacterium TaxID=2614124 RepID=UPI0010F6CBCE|nr:MULTISPECIES: SDR family NAD(P)-dependent oxidoreductase [unclassified Brevibacterium]MCM1013337.1 SDR family NAD(P)-dependent oxidoreductase [Brevibacterium sp. XM4083]
MHVALITGGTAGIGAAFARAFAARGVDLVLVARNRDRLEEFAAELRDGSGVAIETIVADLSDRAAQAEVAERIEAPGSRPPIDILVSNAGFSVRSSLLDPDLRQHDRGFEVMQRTVLVLGGAAARAMALRGRGWIINVCSVSAGLTQNNYTAIKAWTQNYSESLSVQTAGTGVTVTALVPGWVRTEFHARAGIAGTSIPDLLWLDADDLVEECLRDVARGRTVSVPQLRWKAIVAALRATPRPVIHRLSALLTSRRNEEE